MSLPGSPEVLPCFLLSFYPLPLCYNYAMSIEAKLLEIDWLGFQLNLDYLGELLRRDNAGADVLATWETLIVQAEALKHAKPRIQPAQ